MVLQSSSYCSWSSQGSKIKTIDLDSLVLQCSGKQESAGVYKGVYPLNKFPNFVTALKLAINSGLCTYNFSAPSNEIGLIVNRLIFFFSYLIQNGVYRLIDCPPELPDIFAKKLISSSPQSVMNIEFHLKELASEFEINISKAKSLISGPKNRRRINFKKLSLYIGIYVTHLDIPNWFLEYLSSITGEVQVYKASRIPRKTKRSFMKSMLTAVNMVALHPKPLDSLPFTPFPNVNSILRNHFRPQNSQTPNISTNQYVALLSTLLTWVIDYSPHLLKIIEVVREQFEVGDEKSALKAAVSLHSSYVDRGALPPPKIVQFHNTSSPDSLQYLIRMSITAAGYLVIFNHARRANEIFGEYKPYGLYLGCLTENNRIAHRYEIDIYLQKGPKDYHTLPANSLVSSSVDFLERLFNLYRDLHTPEVQAKTPRTAGHHLHLCKTRNLTISGFTDFESYFFPKRIYISPLLTASGINPSDWKEQQTPMRRAWLTLFIHRYDLPEWPAGQRSLGQLDLNSTISYQTDKFTRAPGHAVAELHGREALSLDGAAMIDNLALAKKEYVQEAVRRLFEGTFTGGAFSSLILKLVKKLSGNVSFRKLTEERKAHLVTENLTKRGFSADPMPHIVCMAGTATETRTSANCSVAGNLHKEKASPIKCDGCINGWMNDNYLRVTIAERDRCLEAADDVTLPPAQRESMLATSNQLSAVIDAYVKLSAETKISIEKVILSWQKAGPMKDSK